MTDTRSLQQIKRETEQTRAGLTDTVEQLRTSVADTASDIRQRISPEHIKAEVSDYIRSRGEQLLDDVTAAARRNPMQAVAIGASVAYPLLRMARAIPATGADGRRGPVFCRLQDRTGGLAKSHGHGIRPFGRGATARPRRQRSGQRVGRRGKSVCIR